MSASDIVAELKTIPVGKLATPVEIIECYADTRLKDVVTLLLKNNISSCPVRKTEYKDKPDAEFSEVSDSFFCDSILNFLSSLSFPLLFFSFCLSLFLMHPVFLFVIFSVSSPSLFLYRHISG